MLGGRLSKKPFLIAYFTKPFLALQCFTSESTGLHKPKAALQKMPSHPGPKFLTISTRLDVEGRSVQPQASPLTPNPYPEPLFCL